MTREKEASLMTGYINSLSPVPLYLMSRECLDYQQKSIKTLQKYMFL